MKEKDIKKIYDEKSEEDENGYVKEILKKKIKKD